MDDSDSDDDLVASLVGSGMRGGQKAVGDQLARFRRGESREKFWQRGGPTTCPLSPPPPRGRPTISARAAAVGASSPRAKLLWKKVRNNRLADNGERPAEDAAAEQSRFWRMQYERASAFLFGVDKDIDGRRKNRAEKVMKRVKQLSKRSRSSPGLPRIRRGAQAAGALTSFQAHRLCRTRDWRIRNQEGHPIRSPS